MDNLAITLIRTTLLFSDFPLYVYYLKSAHQ